MAEAAQSQDFARTFGDALVQFLKDKGKSQADAAKDLGLGKKGKSRLNAYCHDSPGGTRPKPNAEILCLLCTKLGFDFQFNGQKISAATFSSNGTKPVEKPVDQLKIEFDGQFNLTDQKGTVSISVKRPPGRVEVTLSLKGAS